MIKMNKKIGVVSQGGNKMKQKKDPSNEFIFLVYIMVVVILLGIIVLSHYQDKKDFTEEGIKLAQENCIKLICEKNAGACPTKLNEISTYCGSLVRGVDMGELVK